MTATTIAPGALRLDRAKPFDARAQRLVCMGRTSHSADAASFLFRAEGGGFFAYEPGQFVTLELPLAAGPLHRTYTLSSTPSRPFAVEVTVKAQGASQASRWMIEHLRPGMALKALAPAGRFTLSAADPAARGYLFVSAGSGATPMMSMLRWLADCAPEADVVYLHVARRPEDILFHHELELIDAGMPNLRLGFLVSQGAGPKGGGRRGWAGPVGRLDDTRLSLLAPDLDGRDVFCCGPEGFMDSVRALLEARGFPMARYHQESFGATGAGEPAPVTAAQAQAAPAGAPIRFTLSDREARAIPGQTVLQAARGAGVRIPAACESGLCGTCKVMAAGPVEMSHNGGILDEEIEEGYILACCSRPTGAISVDA
ncbi:hybrid-cluster NAD(P)-dependent oxidoreductase [Antarcticirhabdus aurantiaca]|uniref:Hybrid-cluster NAD(P)-dependent oxidoreductase n=1 Tax=Antarcticirhabdus aurantiaca TaxID=2606717 RepID=A0ACD4NJE1_9HYPH|nr:hybrid-cluster NAD(P)-dependent oxidoreductase [Antarcticirhabdus aurantiaca]WAJ26811.1 hybrid-cluster NAD(P)-dependent oxidoreductase [Jeongeuplla avenae]